MTSPAEFWYRLKKAYSLYPGILAPVSGTFLADHYRARRGARGSVRALLDAAAGLAFHAWIPLRARASQRRYGLDDAWRKRAVTIARERFADPNDIALFRIDRAEQLDTFVRRFEDAGLSKLINPNAWRSDCVLLDKIAFYERCATHNLPHPQVVATVAGGRKVLCAASAGRPLLLKPARGEGGRGVKVLEGTPPDDPAGFFAWLAMQAGPLRHSWLVQVRIAPHPALKELALNALPTARIITVVNPAGQPEVVNSALRMPVDPDAFVDNMKAGGLLSPIELESGTLGTARRGYGGGDTDVHPISGAVIRGRPLPDWSAAKALVVDAHARAFSEYSVVGWDVALSPDGPMLIEGNGKPSVLLIQRAWQRGVGGQRHGELLAWHLAQAAAGRGKPAVACHPAAPARSSSV